MPGTTENNATRALAEQPEAVKALFRKQLAIQGLRGIGVTGVIVNHMTGLLSSAAAAFDMFFLISGYLITMRLMALAGAGSTRFYFLKFYEFRIRRIFPAAVVTLVVTTLLAYAIYVPARAHDIAIDSVWAFFFLANTHFAATSTDYFSEGFTASPITHFWSLSVEEQFYVFWPIIILLGLWLGLRGRVRGTGVTAVALVVVAVTFPYGWWITSTDSLGAHFTTLGRAWEFAVGAILADFALRYARAQRGTRRVDRVHAFAVRHAPLIEWVGFTVFILALLVTPQDLYPVPNAAFGVLGVTLMLYLNVMTTSRAWIATNRLVVWLGDISYSLYLVHFPVIIFATSYLPANKPLLYAFEVLATLGLSLLMFHFVEEPGRRGVIRTREWFAAKRHRPEITKIAACLVPAVLVFALAPHGLAPRTDRPDNPMSDVVAGNNSPDPSPEPDDPTSPTASLGTKELSRALEGAVALTSWPDLANEDRIGDADAFTGECESGTDLDPPCVSVPASGIDPDKVAVAFGDSTMLTSWPMVRDALTPRGWTVVMFARLACAGSPLRANYGASDAAGCTQHQASYQRVLDRWRPSLVLMSEGENVPPTVMDARGETLQEKQSLAAYATGVRQFVDQAGAEGATVVLISGAPGAIDLTQCKVAGSSPDDCMSEIGDTWLIQAKILRAVTRETGATWADLSSFFCVESLCPSVVGDVAVRADGAHVTPEYSELLAPSFSDYLVRSGVVR